MRRTRSTSAVARTRPGGGASVGGASSEIGGAAAMAAAAAAPAGASTAHAQTLQPVARRSSAGEICRWSSEFPAPVNTSLDEAATAASITVRNEKSPIGATAPTS